ncbi:flotillin-1-like [Tigriopus californicus]|uniref:flotillin-1-like n=1 Tax=Tigriopus californicus TaxID=6832 RepID=UPI0027DAA1BC|nr:flotillin-1-like [Tigriopus californicus]|eukprot:TCALIF_09723-PA protein Name:"Similar to Flo-1 Flotillin-1 (Drosophila melanogaster)" AED:0.01 eAED:0.01 QI:0/-1/0/1/-1/1/1/0/425
MCRMGFITGGPNEAIVVSGCLHSQPLIVVGGWAFVIPCVQKVQRLSLNIMTLKVSSPKVYTMQGVPLSVTGIAQVKITSSNEEMLRAAIEQFIDKSDSDIEEIAMVTLEGHQRAIMGAMTVDEIFRDRKKFSQQVFDIASTDLFNMGIQVISYTLKDVKDEDQYMVSLGMARTSEIQRDARIGEAEANKDSQIETAIAEEQRLASKLINDAEIERYKRDFELKKAIYDIEVEMARAEAEMAFTLQESKVKQRIQEEAKTVDVIERMKLIEVAEQEVSRRYCELDSKIKKPADAEKMRLEILAHANHQRTLLEAAGQAEAIGLKGEADAFTLEAKAKAKAEEMAMKADAWKEYHKAAKVSLWLEALPAITAEVAAPLSQVNKVKMVADPNDKESLGPARLTNEVLRMVENIPSVVQEMTGHRVSLR